MRGVLSWSSQFSDSEKNKNLKKKTKKKIFFSQPARVCVEEKMVRLLPDFWGRRGMGGMKGRGRGGERGGKEEVGCAIFCSLL